jgi:NAD(P)-dependent dehydrogenase (short-subunit alcohol dehydrogenase family)
LTRLKGKVAIVTGGANGIGEAVVREMVKEGAFVLIADIADRLGESLAEELNNNGYKVIYQQTDVSHEDEVERAVNKAIEYFGRLDLLFNNAGINIAGPTDEMPYGDFQKVMEININGIFLFAKHAIRAMKNNGGGSIVNTASVGGHIGSPNFAAYASSKGGVVNLTRALAIEYASRGIRVNSVAPGLIRTSLMNQLDEKAREAVFSIQPMQRMGEPEEVAKAVVFLLSDDASYINGVSLPIDGGWMAQ